MDDPHHLCQKAEHQRCKWKNAGIFISEILAHRRLLPFIIYIYIKKGMEKSVYRSVLIFLISIGIDFHSNVSFLS